MCFDAYSTAVLAAWGIVTLMELIGLIVLICADVTVCTVSTSA